MIPDDQLTTRARRLATALEPCIGGVIFAPEAHDAYQAMGFGPSSHTSNGVAMPDGPAYFASRGSLLGQVPGELVAAAFAVFNPAIVVPCVDIAWGLTDAATIHAARERAGRAQLARVLGAEPDGVEDASAMLQRACADLRPEGRPLYAGGLSWETPTDPLSACFYYGDLLREFRGDSHTAAWVSAGFDATEIGLLAELYLGIAPRTYVRSRAWSDADLDAATERLTARGILSEGAFTESGRARREAIEVSTDAQMRPAIEALGDEIDKLIAIVEPWGKAVKAAGGYPGSAADIAP